MTYFRRVFHYVWPYRRLAIGVIIGIILSALLGLLAPWLWQILIDHVFHVDGKHGKNVPLPWILEKFLGTKEHTLLLFVVIAGLVLVIVDHIVHVINDYVQTKLDQKLMLDFRSDLFQHAQKLPLAFYDRGKSGMLIFRINNNAHAAAGLVMSVPPLVQAAVTLVTMFWIVFHLDRTLALLSLVVVPFLYYSVHYYTTHIQERLMQVRHMEGESLSIIHEAISMLRVTVAFGREDYQFQRFRSQGERAVDARVKLTIRQKLFSLAVGTITGVGTALVLWVGGKHVLDPNNQNFTFGKLQVVLMYIAMVYKPLEQISYTIGSLQEKFISLRMSFTLLDTEPDIRDKPDAVAIERTAGRIQLEGVNFAYAGRRDTLKNINFTAEAGQVVAIVGPTVAGKTTLISLLPRFYTAKSGRILLDGRDTQDITLRSLREQFSLVLQEPLLFSGTIAENIRYGKLDATMDEVMAAAQAANAHEFIMALPDQYETELGERGARLSGGERQRVCVARAFLKDAPILILDEPTSAIDSKTEAVILDALDRLMVGRTTFMIAHRLSTVRRADQVLVLDRGRLVQRGTHDQLVEQRGLYKQLWDMQMAQRNTREKEDPALAQEGGL